MVWPNPRTWLAGEEVTAAKLNELRDGLNAIGDAWPSWVPALTSSGTAPTYTSDGGYIHAGRLVLFWFEITITTAGTGNYTISQPVPARATIFPAAYVLATCYDSGGVLYPRIGFSSGSTSSFVMNSDNGTRVSQTSPFTFGAGDQIAGHGMYEAASAP